MYAIVEFTLTKEVEVVPVTWVSGDQCKWAPVVDRFTFEKYVRKGKKPQSNWNTFEIRILFLSGELYLFLNKTISMFYLALKSYRHTFSTFKTSSYHIKTTPKLFVSPLQHGLNFSAPPPPTSLPIISEQSLTAHP